jgi:hypothetical protein
VPCLSVVYGGLFGVFTGYDSASKVAQRGVGSLSCKSVEFVDIRMKSKWSRVSVGLQRKGSSYVVVIKR